MHLINSIYFINIETITVKVINILQHEILFKKYSLMHFI